MQLIAQQPEYYKEKQIQVELKLVCYQNHVFVGKCVTALNYIWKIKMRLRFTKDSDNLFLFMHNLKRANNHRDLGRSWKWMIDSQPVISSLDHWKEGYVFQTWYMTPWWYIYGRKGSKIPKHCALIFERLWSTRQLIPIA